MWTGMNEGEFAKQLLLHELSELESALNRLTGVVIERRLRVGPRPPKGIDLGCGIRLVVIQRHGRQYEVWREGPESGGPYPCDLDRLAEDIVIKAGRRPRVILRALRRIQARRLWALRQIEVWEGDR